MHTAVKPRIDPTDMSIWRVTMISTMPVVITMIDDDCTSRFQRLRGVRKTPLPLTNAP